MEDVTAEMKNIEEVACGTLLGSIIRTLSVVGDKPVDYEVRMFNHMKEKLKTMKTATIEQIVNMAAEEMNVSFDNVKDLIVLIYHKERPNSMTPLVTLKLPDGSLFTLTKDGIAYGGLIAKYNSELRLLGEVETVAIERIFE